MGYTKSPGEVGRVVAIIFEDGSTSVQLDGRITGRDINNQVIRNILKEYSKHRARLRGNLTRREDNGEADSEGRGKGQEGAKGGTD